jgi:hypothetical protein
MMPTDSINTDVLFAAFSALTLLLAIVYLDRYLARRRRFASNAAYLARIQASRDNSELHQFGRRYQVGRQFRGRRFVDPVYEPQSEVTAPGFFSRRRVISDRFGRVVATHYEEFVMADHLQGFGVSGLPLHSRPRLMLASGKV